MSAGAAGPGDVTATPGATTDRFAVWAPLPHRVRLLVRAVGSVAVDEPARDPVELERGADDWWRVPAGAGIPEGEVDYAYLLDDDPAPRPDPRSRRQPDGVHGPSRTVELDESGWTDGAWPGRELAGSVIYELHVGTFTPGGTLDSAIERLDHLVDLGIDMVELLPVNAVNGTVNWGYDGVLWFAVHEPLGGPAAYQRFVDACHARGLAIIQDVVYNHLGPSGNVLPRFGPYLTDAATTWGDALNLDGPGSAEVRRYILDNALMWLRDYHVDGLRLDAVHALHDSSSPHLLAELGAEVEALAGEVGRPLTLIAESDLNDPVMVMPRSEGGHGLTAQWCDDVHHGIHVALTGETGGYYGDFAPLAALAKGLEGGFVHDGTFSTFRGRVHGAPLDRARVEAWRLVAFAQDHDQIGNRAQGDRLTATLDERGLQLAAVLTLLSPFTPMLFMGEEWGASTPWQFFTSHPEPELARATAEGRIAEFASHGWDRAVVPDPQDPETFRRSRLDWAELDEPAHARVLDLYRTLIDLRRRVPGITDPRLDATHVTVDEQERWLRMRRPGLELAVAFGPAALRLPAPAGVRVAFATGGATLVNDELWMPARSSHLLERAAANPAE